MYADLYCRNCKVEKEKYIREYLYPAFLSLRQRFLRYIETDGKMFLAPDNLDGFIASHHYWHCWEMTTWNYNYMTGGNSYATR